jgi:hypothetical protein
VLIPNDFRRSHACTKNRNIFIDSRANRILITPGHVTTDYTTTLLQFDRVKICAGSHVVSMSVLRPLLDR